jgi:hypothetical protein
MDLQTFTDFFLLKSYEEEEIKQSAAQPLSEAFHKLCRLYLLELPSFDASD